MCRRGCGVGAERAIGSVCAFLGSLVGSLGMSWLAMRMRMRMLLANGLWCCGVTGRRSGGRSG